LGDCLLSSIELSFPGAKRPESERARERIGQGAKGPERKVPWSKLARVLLADSLRGAKRLGTVYWTRSRLLFGDTKFVSCSKRLLSPLSISRAVVASFHSAT